MQRCFSSLGCPDLTLDAILALAARHGIPAVELRSLGGSIDLPHHLATHYGSPARLAAHLSAAPHPVRIAAFDASLPLVGATPAHRADLVALAPWAEALGVPWLRVFDGGKHAGPAEITEAVATLQWWQELRRTHGWRVQLMVETHDSLFTTAALQRLIAAAPTVAILWDSHHTWRKGGEDPLATWHAIHRSVVHVHVKDGTGVPSARHPYTYALPGDGEFPIAPLLAALRADGYGGLVSLEWELLWHSYLPSLDTALRIAAERGWW
jgi:sugar phosphate isomerase/epimerase